MTKNAEVHIMLDLEFMSLRTDAAIVQIGAVKFDPFGDPDAPLPEMNRFRCNVALDSSVRTGGSIDAKTVMWWLAQLPEAQESLIKPEPLDLVDALEKFTLWLSYQCGEAERITNLTMHPNGPFVYGNGATTDNVIFRGAFERLGMPILWSFRHDRCYRTLIGVLDPDWTIDRAQLGVRHNAADDAESQARHLQRVFRASSVRPLEREFPSTTTAGASAS